MNESYYLREDLILHDNSKDNVGIHAISKFYEIITRKSCSTLMIFMTFNDD